jgi:hypothetical protein
MGRPRARRTETERDVQAELRAFSVVIAAIGGRLRALMGVTARLPAYRRRDAEGKRGEDDGHPLAWSIHGTLAGGLEDVEDLERTFQEEAQLTEEACELIEAESRARTKRVKAEQAKEAQKQERLRKALVALADNSDRVVKSARAALKRVHSLPDRTEASRG